MGVGWVNKGVARSKRAGTETYFEMTCSTSLGQDPCHVKAATPFCRRSVSVVTTIVNHRNCLNYEDFVLLLR
jgi:hypothetical protein